MSEVTRVLAPRRAFHCAGAQRLAPHRLAEPAGLPAPARYKPGWCRKLYGRSEEDAFPVRYRANSVRRLNQLANQVGLIFRSHPDHRRPQLPGL